ncbi:MAG: MFS transporter, partial [Pseudomonadota bacterium]
MAAVSIRGGDRLWVWSLYGAVLSGAGLPIYIFAPKYFADTYGVSLATLGTILFALRLFDVVQDPVLGWFSERIGPAKRYWTTGGAALLGLSMLGLFAVAPPAAILASVWFALTITGLFTAFSFLTINFYAEGISRAKTLRGGHIRLAGWRETGALAGVCAASVLPSVLGGSDPFAIFAIGFAVLTLLAALLMAPEWDTGPSRQAESSGVRAILGDKLSRRLLLLAFINAMPAAASSTLFLFFVESRLEAPGWEGPLLVLFFLAAALSAPPWSWLAQVYGTKRILLAAMVLAIVAFGFVLLLEAGDATAFALICIVSGFAVGADLTLMPALFARRLAVVSPQGGQGFGLWAFVQKLTLALSAGILLPILDASGFASGGENPASALTLLTLLYAGLPCALKLGAIALLVA